MKKRGIALTCVAIAMLTFLTGCGNNSSKSTEYTDGVYSAKSSEDDRGAYGEVTVTIEGGKITACEYVTWQKDGTVKDENYGKVNGEISNQDYYDKAQNAVDAMKKYAAQLVEVQKLDDVDTVSGATVSFDQFTEAVTAALEDAQ